MMDILNVKTRENSHDIHVNLWRVFCFILFYFRYVLLLFRKCSKRRGQNRITERKIG